MKNLYIVRSYAIPKITSYASVKYFETDLVAQSKTI